MSEPWQQQANCIGLTDAMYPDEGQVGWGQYSIARRICERCLVTDQCLRYALENAEQHGMWGGLTPHERNRLRRLAG